MQEIRNSVVTHEHFDSYDFFASMHHNPTPWQALYEALVLGAWFWSCEH